MKLKKHKFGHTDLCVSELCLSTSNFARYADRDASFAILDAFHAAGGNLVQTSGICPGVNLGDGFLGMPEEMLGRWISDRRIERDRIVIATRIALTRPVIGGMDTFTSLVRRCAADSIRRMGCDYLDILVVEWTDAVLPVCETAAALDAAIDAGEVRYVMPANFPPERVLELMSGSRHQEHAVPGLQIDYSLAARTPFEAGVARLAADHGLSVIARSPFAGGHLACREILPMLTGLRIQNWPDHLSSTDSIRRMLAAMARAQRRTMAEVALAWVLSHPQVTSVLVSVRSAQQLTELAHGATQLELTGHDLARLGAASAGRHSTAVP